MVKIGVHLESYRKIETVVPLFLDHSVCFLCCVFSSYLCCVAVIVCVRILLLRWSAVSKSSVLRCLKTRSVHFALLSFLVLFSLQCLNNKMRRLLQQLPKVYFSVPAFTWSNCRRTGSN